MKPQTGPPDPGRYDEDYRTLRHAAGVVYSERDVISVQGADAEGYLQGQLSQDVAALGVGETAWSLLLHPNGKLHTRLRITRTGPEHFTCDTEAGSGEAALVRLQRFKLRVAAELTLRRLAMAAVRGPLAPPVPPAGANGTGEAVVSAPVRWGALGGWDLVAAEPVVPPWVTLCDPAALEAVRIESGVPAPGSELIEGMIPAEAGIVAETVSFTKGCYVGQELVARIDSRGGNTPRRLRGLLLAGPDVPVPGTPVLDAAGAEVGRVTSSAFSPLLGAAVALAYVHRRVDVPAPAHLAGAGAVQVGEIRALPLVP